MKERVQLNLSVTLEQKLALQVLAEGYGTSVTKLVLGLIEQGGGVDQAVGTMTRRSRAVKGRSEETPMSERQPPASLVSASPVITSPAEVPSAVERVVERNAVSMSHQARAFSPYSKEQQTGKAKKGKAEPVQPCRHGLLRCKVCGTG